MKERHYLNCSAPICNDDPHSGYKDEVIWYPGEAVCKRKPIEKFQIIQARMNESFKKGGFQDTNGFTASQLESSSY